LLAKPEIHPKFGFSLIVTDIHFLDTLGPAERKLRDAIKKLAAEGIIRKNATVPDPEFILRVAVIAPVNSEGQRDFVRILESERERAPIQIRTFPAVFQSENAPTEISDGLLRAALWKPDVIVLVRGGGSKADLLYLNDYAIGRAICDCPIPVWSGIGHSTDKTLIDEVAARSFKTPSDAAHQMVQITAQIVQSAQNTIKEAARCAQRVSAQMAIQQQTTWARIKSNAGSSLDKAAAETIGRAQSSVANGKLIAQSWDGRLAGQSGRAKHFGAAILAKAQSSARDITHSARMSAMSIYHEWNNSIRLKDRQTLECGRASIRALQHSIAAAVHVTTNVTARLSQMRQLLLAPRNHSITLFQHAIAGRQQDLFQQLRLAHSHTTIIIKQATGVLDRKMTDVERADLNGPLARGFALVADSTGRWLKRVIETRAKMRIIFADGTVNVEKKD
jgi:exonuclease VII large subunit